MLYELFIVVPSSLFLWRYFTATSQSKSSAHFSTQTEPGIWLPVLNIDIMDLDEPVYDSSEDIVMTPVDSHDIMTYRDYCA